MQLNFISFIFSIVTGLLIEIAPISSSISISENDEEILLKSIKQASNKFLKDITANNFDALIKFLMISERKGQLTKCLSETNSLQILWNPMDAEHDSSLLDIPMLIDPSFQSAVTYDLNGGRVGDSLISYFHAKWIAMKYGLPFLYRPFPDSEIFDLSNNDQRLSDFFSFGQTLTISKKEDIETALSGTLIVVPYFPDVPFELLTLGSDCEYFPIQWNDPKFKREVRKCLHPKDSVKQFHLSENNINIAVHVRRGGTWDHYDSICKILPLKFPPYSYYIEQIQQVALLFPNLPLYVYIFTDDLNPAHIAKMFDEAIHNPFVTFDWHRSSQLGSNKFEDFYALAYFDCLIRPASNFSLIASQLNDIPLVIAPTHCFFDRGQIIIDEVVLQFGGKSIRDLY